MFFQVDLTHWNGDVSSIYSYHHEKILKELNLSLNLPDHDDSEPDEIEFEDEGGPDGDSDSDENGELGDLWDSGWIRLFCFWGVRLHTAVVYFTGNEMDLQVENTIYWN